LEHYQRKKNRREEIPFQLFKKDIANKLITCYN
jgi:hypothetical protein